MIESATSEIDPSTYFISTSYFLIDSSSMILHGFAVPTRKCDASSIFPIVADNPIRTILLLELYCSLSILNESCDPLSFARSSWISSMTSHSSSERADNIFSCVSKITRVSGVVINTSGGAFEIFFRVDCGVSPCLISISSSSLCA